MQTSGSLDSSLQVENELQEYTNAAEASQNCLIILVSASEKVQQTMYMAISRSILFLYATNEESQGFLSLVCQSDMVRHEGVLYDLSAIHDV